MRNSDSELVRKVTRLKGYAYRVWEYQASHSRLTVRATHPDEAGHNIHIVFHGVAYFQMPIHWKRGDFRLDSDAKRRAIANRIGLPDVPSALLFIANTPDTVVHVLGAVEDVLYDVEPVY